MRLPVCQLMYQKQLKETIVHRKWLVANLSINFERSDRSQICWNDIRSAGSGDASLIMVANDDFLLRWWEKTLIELLVYHVHDDRSKYVAHLLHQPCWCRVNEALFIRRSAKHGKNFNGRHLLQASKFWDIPMFNYWRRCVHRLDSYSVLFVCKVCSEVSSRMFADWSVHWFE